MQSSRHSLGTSRFERSKEECSFLKKRTKKLLLLLEHDPVSSGQPPDEHARKNKDLERDASINNESNRSHPALGGGADGGYEIFYLCA
jgi:hypothetical protein